MEIVRDQEALTDAGIASRLGVRPQAVNGAARRLQACGRIERKKLEGGCIGNYRAAGDLTEEEMKTTLAYRLRKRGWQVEVAWGHRHGVDIQAHRGDEIWRIEVKGPGSRPAMRHNYLLAILGEILLRMDREDARYSICLPDMAEYRELWAKLPSVAKRRTRLSALFVGANGRAAPIDEICR